jgi:hypothetical protein
MNRRLQSGVTGWGLLVWALLVGFFGLLAVRLAPIYMDHYQALSALESLKPVLATDQESKTKIRDLFRRRLDINNVDTVKPDELELTKTRDGLYVAHIAYEVRRPMLGNVEVVVSFDDTVEVVRRGRY